MNRGGVGVPYVFFHTLNGMHTLAMVYRTLKNFPDLGKREVLAALTRLPVAAREEGRRFRFTRRTLPRGPCSMEQQREKRKDRRNEQLVAALADNDQERWAGAAISLSSCSGC